ncbi:hypothetical protein BHAOGJBA_5346 [Methylobacterium hispanicum]|uniref:Glutamine amidotransferase n=1 Tax=Methylobacterium hispanicum TaxID=270350 RepID=A0AAV4ZU42_9HYPH|nr:MULTISPECIES: glutamine amidotransferase [Methylobacterium]GJD91793.1 hypothetical protein BHAOGJBA_5346 [Methylobacterium hispanicum]
MFTLEIDGTAVAVINGDEETARDLFTCDGFKSDIRELTSAGKPLWNGTSELKVRPATEDEVEMFEDALADDDGSGDFEPVEAHADSEEDEDEADIVFLVDIDEEDEDDEDGQKLDA